jgi:dTDP-4-amino-4,6-dideoxygalactose transaminase
MTARIPFLELRPGEDAAAVRQAIDRVIARGWFVLGPELEAFEREFAAASGTPEAAGVGTGTDAIALALRAAGVGAGDEVITSPLSATYSALAIVMAGARPVFADVDPSRLTLDPAAAAAAITPRTAAIVPVHLYGQAADMPALAAVAARHNLAIIEDCCQAHLATSDGRPVGTFGVAGAFSFYPTKNLGALGDGGMVVTGDAALASRVRRLRNGGQIDRYHHQESGVNSRLDEVQAAVLSARLPFLRGWTDRRRTLAARYRQTLTSAGCVAVPAEHDHGHVYHLFVVRCSAAEAHENAGARNPRDTLQLRLASAGVETLVHYPIPISQQPAMAEWAPASCPHAQRAADEVLSLPLYPSMPDRHVDEVAELLCAY